MVVVGDVSKKNSGEKITAWKKYCLIISVCVLSYVLGWYFIGVFNPLVSDESIILHFREHRDEFVELAKRYREYSSPDGYHSHWAQQGDTPDLITRVNAGDISYAAGVWLPNPYAIETAKELHELEKNATDLSVLHRFGTLRFSLLLSGTRGFSILHTNIWKDLCFYPEQPRIESGWLLYPVDRYGRITYKEKVVPSLNTLPRDWKRGCVLKQLEPNWFISMCRN